MACEFAAVMNPGPPRQVMLASDALDMIHVLEAQMTVYRPQSELSQLNRRADASRSLSNNRSLTSCSKPAISRPKPAVPSTRRPVR